MTENSTQTDGYYNEDTDIANEDFDLSFLDDDESKQ